MAPLLATVVAAILAAVWFYVAPYLFHGAHSVDLVPAVAVFTGWAVLFVVWIIVLIAWGGKQLRRR